MTNIWTFGLLANGVKLAPAEISLNVKIGLTGRYGRFQPSRLTDMKVAILCQCIGILCFIRLSHSVLLSYGKKRSWPVIALHVTTIPGFTTVIDGRKELA